MTRSALEGVPGSAPPAGPGCCASSAACGRCEAASLEELLALPWLPDPVAGAVHAQLHALPPRPGFPVRSRIGLPAGSRESDVARRRDGPAGPE